MTDRTIFNPPPIEALDPVSPWELLMLASLPREEALAIADRSARQCASERAAIRTHHERGEFGEGGTVRVVSR